GPGFRLEGQPQLEIPFADADAYRKTVDRFLSLHDQMQELRDDFSRSVQEVLARVSAEPSTRERARDRERDKDKLARGEPRHPRRCPEADLAAPFARAFQLGQQFLRAGRELERAFTQVRDLNQLGETQGLTPDYRFKVKRVLELYRSLVADYREMKLSFHNQLTAEVKFFGCDPDQLIARAERLGRDAAARTTTDVSRSGGSPVAAGGGADKDKDELRTAAVVSFYIDNQRCSEPVRVFLDQVPIGKVEGAARGGFRANAGPHDLCLLAANDPRQCGATGTIRRAYIHDGFSLTLRCGSR